jgi:hypothetical protein
MLLGQVFVTLCNSPAPKFFDLYGWFIRLFVGWVEREKIGGFR